jgi:hypothetical protein
MPLVKRTPRKLFSLLSGGSPQLNNANMLPPVGGAL